MIRVACLLSAFLIATPALADAPQVTSVVATQGPGGWTFEVTVRHPDTGWDHYADGWRIELPDGTVVATRELLHPHVDEQPFTRSLAGVAIPAGVTQVRIRSRCLVDGWSPDTVSVSLP
jgi:hypothetical protein